MMDGTTTLDGQKTRRSALLKSVRAYQKVDVSKSVTQVVVALSVLCMLYATMITGVHLGHFEALILAPLTAGFLVRTFILQHDCGHGSLFTNKVANRWVGRLCSIFTFTPYDHWRAHHAIHHQSWNNLSTRGRLSDMYSDCITVAEYQKMSALEKIAYKLSKNPIIALLVLPPIIFVIVYRIPFDTPKKWRREKYGVHLTSLAIVALFAAVSYAADWKSVAIVALTTLYIASVFGVWLFLVQHKFEGALWRHGPAWDFVDASLAGCSLLKLPAILEWFSGHIGYHHIHHIAPGVPNYNLKPCHDVHPEFQDVKVIKLREGIDEIHRHELWDDVAKEMVPFRDVRPATKVPAPACP